MAGARWVLKSPFLVPSMVVAREKGANRLFKLIQPLMNRRNPTSATLLSTPLLSKAVGRFMNHVRVMESTWRSGLVGSTLGPRGGTGDVGGDAVGAGTLSIASDLAYPPATVNSALQFTGHVVPTNLSNAAMRTLYPQRFSISAAHLAVTVLPPAESRCWVPC